LGAGVGLCLRPGWWGQDWCGGHGGVVRAALVGAWGAGKDKGKGSVSCAFCPVGGRVSGGAGFGWARVLCGVLPAQQWLQADRLIVARFELLSASVFGCRRGLRRLSRRRLKPVVMFTEEP